MSGRTVGRHPLHDGVQFVEQYENGYGVSVVSHGGSYGGNMGRFEVAVLHGTNLDLCYATPITNDVLGWLDWADVANVVDRVQSLPLTHDCQHKAPPADWEEVTVTMEAGEWRQILDALDGDFMLTSDNKRAIGILSDHLAAKNVAR